MAGAVASPIKLSHVRCAFLDWRLRLPGCKKQTEGFMHYNFIYLNGEFLRFVELYAKILMGPTTSEFPINSTPSPRNPSCHVNHKPKSLKPKPLKP